MFYFFQDPTSQLLQLAEAKGLAQKFHALSLGQGQAPIATRMIKEGIREVGICVFIFESIITNNFLFRIDNLFGIPDLNHNLYQKEKFGKIEFIHKVLVCLIIFYFGNDHHIYFTI